MPKKGLKQLLLSLYKISRQLQKYILYFNISALQSNFNKYKTLEFFSQMQLQNQVAEIRSLTPIQSLCPIYSIQRRPWYRVYRAQCMIPFHTYSIKVVYIITFIAFKIYVRIELYLVPMVYPQAFPIQYLQIPASLQQKPEIAQPIPLASYSFNCMYCGRCKLGVSCKYHIPGNAFCEQIKKQKQKMERQNKNQAVIQAKMEES